MKLAGLLLALILLGPDSGPLRRAPACVIAAWNAYNPEAARRCYATSAVALQGSKRVAIDWEAERRYRAFDAAAHSRFHFDVLRERDSIVSIALHEQNDFLQALGLPGITTEWHYTVRDGRIISEQLGQRDSAFAARYRSFHQWAMATRPAGWNTVLDTDGDVSFHGGTAAVLIAAASQWSASHGSP